MKSRSVCAAALLLVAASLSAAERRTNLQRDQIVSREMIRPDVESITFRVRNGLVERVTGGGTVDEMTRNADGRTVEMTTRYRGLTFTAKVTESEIDIPGFPKLQLVYREDGRLESIMTENGRVLSYVYDAQDGIARIELGAHTLELARTPEGLIQQTLRDASGSIVRDALSAPRAARRQPSGVILDLVRGELGLGDDWLNKVRNEPNATTTVETLFDAEGKALAYVWRYEGLWVVYDLEGKPLFMQLFMDGYTQTADLLSGVPMIFTMTPGGRTGIHNDAPLEGGIEGLWSGAKGLEHRWIEEPSAKDGIQPNLMMICDQTTVCTSIENGPTHCTITRYWCDVPSGGGGGPSGPYEPPTGGGGRPSTPSTGKNLLSGTAKAALDRSINKAKDQVSKENCKNLFGTFKATDGKPLTDKLSALGKTPSSFLDMMTWRPGQSQKDSRRKTPCKDYPGTIAWTSPGSTTVYVCDSFERVNEVSRSLRVIHEELHSLGVSENPPDRNAPTDAQIDGAIAANCK
jgi:hypothetical protein